MEGGDMLGSETRCNGVDNGCDSEMTMRTMTGG